MGTVRYTVIDGEVIAEKRNGVRKLYVPDPLGSTVALLDNTQAQTDTFSYWPYGEDAGRTGSTPTPFQYVGTAGYYRDSSIRDYVRTRTLSTLQGRWITEDPIGYIGGDWNFFRYVMDSPMSGADVSGMSKDYKPPWLNPRSQTGRKTRACLHNAISEFSKKYPSCMKAFNSKFPNQSLYKMMLCIMACENSDPPSSTNPFKPDRGHKIGDPETGIGPCRLNPGDKNRNKKYNDREYPKWDKNYCQNIRAGLDLMCKWVQGKLDEPQKDGTVIIMPSPWNVMTDGYPCYSQCMADKSVS